MYRYFVSFTFDGCGDGNAILIRKNSIQGNDIAAIERMIGRKIEANEVIISNIVKLQNRHHGVINKIRKHFKKKAIQKQFDIARMEEWEVETR